MVFVRGHTVLFFCLSYLDSTIRHKFFTLNCVPLGKEELGSSLPNMGGGGSMTLFEVLMLLIQFGLLVVAVLTYMQM